LDTTRSCPSAPHHTRMLWLRVPPCPHIASPLADSVQRVTIVPVSYLVGPLYLLPFPLQALSSNGCAASQLPQEFRTLFQRAEPALIIADGHAADELAASAECRDGASAAGSDAAGSDGRCGSRSASRHAGTRHALHFKKIHQPVQPDLHQFINPSA
jgi:hypothetical protein